MDVLGSGFIIMFKATAFSLSLSIETKEITSVLITRSLSLWDLASTANVDLEGNKILGSKGSYT